MGAAKEAKAKKKLQKKGKKALTGRELFSLTPNIFTDDDNATETIVFEKDMVDEEKGKNDSNNNDNNGNNNNEDTSESNGKNDKNDKNNIVDNIGDASLFLEMDDMLDEMEIID